MDTCAASSGPQSDTSGGGCIGGQRVGCMQVSSLDQNPDRQLDGVALDRTLTVGLRDAPPVRIGAQVNLRRVGPIPGEITLAPPGYRQLAHSDAGAVNAGMAGSW